MQFQQALCQVMEERHVSQEMLAARTDANPRWIVEVTTNPEWHPKLDTILRLCLALRYDVISFLELAEVGSRGLAPSSKLQAPSSKLQAPSSKLQAPSSKQRRFYVGRADASVVGGDAVSCVESFAGCAA